MALQQRMPFSKGWHPKIYEYGKTINQAATAPKNSTSKAMATTLSYSGSGIAAALAILQAIMSKYFKNIERQQSASGDSTSKLVQARRYCIWHNDDSVTIMVQWRQHGSNCPAIQQVMVCGMIFLNNNQPVATVPASKAMAIASQHSSSGNVADLAA